MIEWSMWWYALTLRKADPQGHHHGDTQRWGTVESQYSASSWAHWNAAPWVTWGAAGCRKGRDLVMGASCAVEGSVLAAPRSHKAQSADASPPPGWTRRSAWANALQDTDSGGNRSTTGSTELLAGVWDGRLSAGPTEVLARVRQNQPRLVRSTISATCKPLSSPLWTRKGNGTDAGTGEKGNNRGTRDPLDHSSQPVKDLVDTRPCCC